ncbi:hypothetical protein BJ741DRAFT_597988, partial [Chytriomyces cf. hyalinus JEL632]
MWDLSKHFQHTYSLHCIAEVPFFFEITQGWGLSTFIQNKMSSSEPLPQRSLSITREQDILKPFAEIGTLPDHLIEASRDALSESTPVIAAASRSKSVVIDSFRRNSSRATSVTAADDAMERRQSMNLNRFISKVNTVYDMEKIVPSANGFAEYLATETSSDEDGEEDTNTPMPLMSTTPKSKRQSLQYNSEVALESSTPQPRRQSINWAATSTSRQTSIIKSAVADDGDATPTSSSGSSLHLNFLRRMSEIANSMLPSFANNAAAPSDQSANARDVSKTSPKKPEELETIIDMSAAHSESQINASLPPLPQKRTSLNAPLFSERPTAPKILPPLAPPVFTLSHAKFAEDDQIPAMVAIPAAQPEQKTSRRTSLTIPKSLFGRTDSEKHSSTSNSNSEVRLSTGSQRNTTTQRHARTIYLGGNVATPVTSHQAMSLASPIHSRSSIFLNANPIPLSPTPQKRRSISGLTIPSPNSITADRRRSASTGIVIPSTPSRIQVAVAAGENVIPLLKNPGAPENEPLSEAALMYLDAFSILRSQATAATPTERRPAMKPDRVEETKLDSFGKVVRIASEMKQAGLEPSVAAELDKDTLTMVLKLKKWARQKRRNKDHNVHEFLNIKKFNAEVETQLPTHLQIDLIQDVLPIVTGYARTYSTQLGQGHGFTAGAAKHLQKLTERYEKGCCTKGTG